MARVSEPHRGFWIRLAVATLLAAGAAVAAALLGDHLASRGQTASDYDQVWIASFALLHGADPYAIAATAFSWGTVYQPPAFILNLPLALLPIEWARSAFMALGIGALAFGMSGTGWWKLFAFASGCMLWSVIKVQWTPLLMAGVFLPPLSIAWITKPGLGIALWVGWPRRSAAVAAALLLAASWVLVPGWLDAWRHEAEANVHIVAAVSRPFGWLLLLALLRWKRPEARFLAAFALVPHTELWYDLLLLFLVPRTAREATLLTILSLVGVWWSARVAPMATNPLELEHTITTIWPVMLVLMYLPALAMVLRRPNVGDWPEWLRRHGREPTAYA